MTHRDNRVVLVDYEVDELLDDIAWDLFEFNYRDLGIEERMSVLVVAGNVIDAQEFGYGHTYGDLDRYERAEVIMQSLPMSQKLHAL